MSSSIHELIVMVENEKAGRIKAEKELEEIKERLDALSQAHQSTIDLLNRYAEATNQAIRTLTHAPHTKGD